MIVPSAEAGVKPKGIDTYLENLGVPAGIRTQIASFERSKTIPLSYRDYSSMEQGAINVKSEKKI